MLIKLKRIYSYFIELLAVLVICFLAYNILNSVLVGLVSDSFKISQYMYLYIRPIFVILILLYLCLRNILKGQSILQKLFGIKCLYSNKKQLIFKNIIDLWTLPLSFLTILFWNKSIGDYIFKISVAESANDGKKRSNTLFYLMAVWFTITSFIFSVAFNWRVQKAEQNFIFRLNNTQTIKDNIGDIKSFSFQNKILWTQYDKEGAYTKAIIKNTENQKFKIKIYYSNDDRNYSYFIIDGQKYAYEIEHFSLKDYLQFTKRFTDDIKVNQINNEKDIATSAKAAYAIKFSKKMKNYVAYELFYDKENDCYMIHYVSRIDKDTLGGDYNIIIQRNGHVLAMWGEK